MLFVKKMCDVIKIFSNQFKYSGLFSGYDVVVSILDNMNGI